MDPLLTTHHFPEERHVSGLEAIVQLLVEPRLDLGPHVVHDQCALILAQDAQHEVEAAEIRFDRARHVGILQLAGELSPVEPDGAMDLAKGSSCGGGALEAREAVPPAIAELGPHAAVDEGHAHGRRLRLERDQLGDVFGWQRTRHSRQELRQLDDRAAQVAERLAQLASELGPVLLDAEIALGGEA